MIREEKLREVLESIVNILDDRQEDCINTIIKAKRIASSALAEPEIQKMGHYGQSLANKDYKTIIQMVWDKLNELISAVNELRRGGVR